MPPKMGTKKSAKSDDDTKKKETNKGSKKGTDEGGVPLAGSNDIGSSSNDNNSSSKVPPGNLMRGTSQLGTPSEENANREPGASTSELSHHTDGGRDGADGGESAAGTALADTDIKYEEPILPNLIVQR